MNNQEGITDFEAAYYQLLSDLNPNEKGAYLDEEYPFNLLHVLDPSDFDGSFPSDIKGTAEYVLYTMLTPRECLVVHLRFQDKKKLKEVAETIGVQTERARQILARAIRKLRYPVRYNLLRKGVEAYRAEFGEGKRKEGLEAGLAKAKEMVFDIRKAEEEAATAAESREHPNAKYRLNESIDCLDFSVRTWNCLRRSSINTIGELLAVENAAALMQIRNLGRKSIEEIVARLTDCGFDATHLA